MSNSLGDMVVSFSADISNLSSGISQAQSQVSGFSDAVQSQGAATGGFFSGLFGHITDFVGGVADAATSIYDFGQRAVDLTLKLLEPDAAMEQMTVAFTTLMHSSSAAKDELQQLSDFAAKTPFQMMDLDAGAAKLLAFGESSKELIPDLTAIGDALSALGEATPARLGMVVDIFGKIDTQGKLTQGIMQQFSRDGINAWQALADATGKTIPAVQEMVKKGLIPAAQGTADLRKGLEMMYGGGMANQAQTFNGLMSTFKDNIEAAWRSFSGPLFDAAKGALSFIGNIAASNQFQDFAKTLGTDVAGAFSSIGGLLSQIGQQLVWVTKQPLFQEIANVINTTFVPALQNIGSLLGGLASNFLPQGDQIEGVSQTIMQALQNIEPVVGTVGNAFLDFSKFLQQNSGYFQEFFNILSVTGGQAFKILSDALSGLTSNAGGMSGLFTSFKPFFDALSNHMPDIESFVHLIGDTLVGAAQTIAPVIKQVGDIIGGQLASNLKFAAQTGQQLAQWWKADMWPAIQQALPGFEHLATVILTDVVPGLAHLWAMGQQLVQHITSAFLPVFEKAEPILVRLAGIINEGLAQAIHFLMPYVLQAGQAIMKFAGDIADRVAPILLNFWKSIQEGLDWLQANWKYIWPSLSKILEGIWNVIVGILKTAWAVIAGIVKVGLDLISGNWGQAWTDIKDMFAGIWDGITTLLSGFVDMAWGMISGFVTGIVGLFQNLYDQLVGHSIIPDMINGIIASFTNLGQVVPNLVQHTVEAVGNFFSGLADKLVGHSIIPDMNNGITASFQGMALTVKDTTKQLAQNVAQNMADMKVKGYSNVDSFTSDAMSMFEKMGKYGSDQMQTLDKNVIGYWNDVAAYIANHPITGVLNIDMGQGSTYSHLSPGLQKNYFASGVMNAPAGWAMVGENGPELMHLHGGEDIYPNGTYPSNMAYPSTAAAYPSSGGGMPIIHIHNHNHNYVDGIEMTDIVGNRQMQLAQARMGVRQWG